MRTTLTLDDDVAAKLREQTRKTGKPFKVLVNEVLRLGLAHSEHLSKKSTKPFIVKAKNFGLKPGMSYDNVAELLDREDSGNYK